VWGSAKIARVGTGIFTYFGPFLMIVEKTQGSPVRLAGRWCAGPARSVPPRG
jgi:hypothetical protein